MTHGSDHANKEPIITYHRNQMSKEPAYLEISDTTVMAALDNIIRVFPLSGRRTVN